jgi:hypothetical protein
MPRPSSPPARSAPRLGHRIATVAAGFLVGALVIATTLHTWMRKLEGPATDDLPVLALRPGSTAWEPVSAWPEPADSPGLEETRDPGRPTGKWLPLTADSAIAHYLDDAPCTLLLEPGDRRVPRLPADCTNLEALGRLGGADGPDVLAIIAQGTAYRAWVLDTGADAWREVEPPPQEMHGELVVGPGAHAVWGGFGEGLARYDEGHWERLPAPGDGRYGFDTRLLEDGTVVIAGGQRDEAGIISLAFSMLPLAVGGICFGLVIVARRRWPVDMASFGIGLVLAVCAAIAGVIAILPSGAWH